MPATNIKDTFTNRAPWDMQRHDTMFDLNVKLPDGSIDPEQQLANDTSAYNVTYDNFRYKIELRKDGQKIADVEDLRVVWKNLQKAQCKLRITGLVDDAVVAEFNRSDNIKVWIETKAVAHNDSPESETVAEKYPDRKLSMEPPKTFTPNKYLGEPENVTTMTIAPNKWLYMAGVFADV